MPDLRPPAVEPVVEDDTAADSRAEREQDEVGEPLVRRPSFHSASAAAFASFSTPTGRPKRARACPARSKSSNGRFVARSTRPVPRSRFAGTPKPIAPTRVVEHRLHASSSACSTASSEVPGLSRLVAQVDDPSRSTTPERIFVPPTSTPITRGAPTAAGYHSAPNGRGRQALPAVSRWPRQGQSPSRKAQAARRASPPTAQREASRSPPLGPLDRPRRRRPARAHRRLGSARLPLLLERRRRGERASPAPRRRPARRARRIALLGAGDDPRHRDRRRQGARPRATRAARTRSCCCAPIPASTGLSYLSIPRDLRVDIPGYGSGKINAANQVGGPALTLATVRSADRPADPPRRRLRLRRVPRADRRARRGRRERAEADPLEQVRLPVQARALRQLGRLALREGDAAHGRQARARLRAHSLEPERLRRTTTSRAGAASRRSPTPSATRSRASGRSSGSRSSATRWPRRS